MTVNHIPRPLVFLTSAGLAGCDGPQSALVTAGRDAEQIAHLFTVMAGGAAIVWAAVVGIAIYAIRTRRETHSQREVNLLISGGGVAVPTVVLESGDYLLGGGNR